ncbi:MAG: hypothetical protein GX879_05265, partial [Bacteroidales bacterium]|nr:hypothetical protein [Bacteroidales bacterium]
MKKKISLILYFLTLFYINTYSQKVEFSDAKQIANSFYSANTNIQNPEIKSELKFKASNSDMITLFSYQSGGFVAVALWQGVKPILAYSFQGNHSLEDIPLNTMSWFLEYAKRINKLKTNNIIDPKAKAEWLSLKNNKYQAKSAKSMFLLSTEWGQNCYYNSLCPEDPNGPCGHAVTGCVATSMAMIMKHHNYPQFGKGSHSYISNNYGELSADFENTEYLWNEMPNVLTEENLAVATLM